MDDDEAPSAATLATLVRMSAITRRWVEASKF